MPRTLFVLSLFVVGVLSAGCGTGTKPEAHPDALVGKITHNGQPVKSVTVTVLGADGTPAGGTTNDEGTYTIPNPPKGQLKFQLVAPGSGKPPFPAKYAQPNNDLTFDYTGGKQTYDMILK